MPVPPLSRRISLLLALASGLVTDLGFPGAGLWPLTFVGVGLLVVAMGRDSARWNAFLGLVHGLAFFLPHIWWAHEAVGPVPWLALSLAEAGFVAAFGAAWSWARRGEVIWHRARWQVPAFAVVWAGMEEARSVWPFGGFPWGRLAFSQADSPLLAWAWVGGAPLVSALTAAIGFLLAVAVSGLRRTDLLRTTAPVLAALLVLGSGLLLPLGTRAEAGTLKVAAVQGNVPNRGLDSFLQEREVLENHVSGTLAVAERVGPDALDLVLWPENGSDIDPRVDPQAGAAVQAAASAVAAPILVGTLEYPADGGRLNISLLWDDQSGPGPQYAKQHPAPFAEYIPMRSIARLFSEDVDRVRTDMVPGTEVGLVDVPVERLDRVVGIGTVICFEVAYDDLVRDAVAAGSEVLVVPTNNATFGLTDEATQQLAMSRLRAVEHGRATVQVSTVGVSGIISPSGQVRQSTGLFTADQLVADLPLRTTPTPATRYGDAVAWTMRVGAVSIVLAGLAGAARIRREDRVVVHA